MTARTLLLWDVDRRHPAYLALAAVVLLALFLGDFGPMPGRSGIVVKRLARDLYLVAFRAADGRRVGERHEDELLEAANNLRNRLGFENVKPLRRSGFLTGVLVSRSPAQQDKSRDEN